MGLTLELLDRRARSRATLVGFVVCASVAVSACTGLTALGGVKILRYGPMNGGPAALIDGELGVAPNGCVELWRTNDDLMLDRWTILWPATTQLQQIGPAIYVSLDGDAATEGDSITLGGGEERDQAFVERLVGPVGDCRADVYWLATTLDVTHN